MNPVLSVCIPTYNRASLLKECLASILESIKGFESEVEIVISDNASTDNTKEMIQEFQIQYPWIRYHRNTENIGAERNFRLVASIALSENIWIFGDDDKMSARTIAQALANVHNGNDLTICNFSVWNKDFSTILNPKWFKYNGSTIKDANVLLEKFGLEIGFISCIIIKKEIFLLLSENEYNRYSEYGFPFIYAVYTGIAKNSCKIGFISDAIVLNRAFNSGDYPWYKYFVSGSSLIFDELLHKGYTRNSISAAKKSVLTKYVIKNMVGLKLTMTNIENNQVITLLYKYYKQYWQFWIICLPILLTPNNILLYAKKSRTI